MLRTETRFVSGKAEAYGLQLGRHFAHKITVEPLGEDMVCRFEHGTARLSAREGVLTVTVAAPTEPDLEAIKDTIDRHLRRFAHREAPGPLVWTV